MEADGPQVVAQLRVNITRRLWLWYTLTLILLVMTICGALSATLIRRRSGECFQSERWMRSEKLARRGSQP